MLLRRQTIIYISCRGVYIGENINSIGDRSWYCTGFFEIYDRKLNKIWAKKDIELDTAGKLLLVINEYIYKLDISSCYRNNDVIIKYKEREAYDKVASDKAEFSGYIDKKIYRVELPKQKDNTSIYAV